METAVIIVLIVLVPIAFFSGYYFSSRNRRKDVREKKLEEYSFYPFLANAKGQVEFKLERFNEAVTFLLLHKNTLASKQLIIIGEQTNVQDILSTEDLNEYMSLYDKFDGRSLLLDNERFMENYKRIVTLIGKSFKGTGMEILLHNLVNPTKSIVAIENGEVTGRKLENGTTNLLLDLITRKEHNQDKLNYELHIGARKFKCTTIPIFRRDFGLVGAICINVDMNFVQDVKAHEEKLEAFINNFLKTDFRLYENILSPEEYKEALNGKRHYTDDVLLARDHHKTFSNTSNRLMVIFFSDIKNYSALMNKNETQALNILNENRKIHQMNMLEYNGQILKEVGDGILASFQSVSDAVKCAASIQKQVKEAQIFELRIGIHLGEVYTENNDVYGDGVNIASRIQSEALPGTVSMSEAVYSNIRNKTDDEIIFVGKKDLKNIDGPVSIYQLNIS